MTEYAGEGIPKITDEMRINGYTWSKRVRDDGQEVWVETCTTCGGNCGQCGNTDRLGNVGLGDGRGSLAVLHDNLTGKKPRTVPVSDGLAYYAKTSRVDAVATFLMFALLTAAAICAGIAIVSRIS